MLLFSSSAAIVLTNPPLIDTPTTAGVDPTTCAQNLAAFVKANDLDGVDIDYEDNNAFNTGVAEAWLISTPYT